MEITKLAKSLIAETRLEEALDALKKFSKESGFGNGIDEEVLAPLYRTQFLF